MVSKICPVCRTFSSSSNTTLNAHMDQCLRSHSPPRRTIDLKVAGSGKVRRRKTRLLSDIYASTPRCSLNEDFEADKHNQAQKSSSPWDLDRNYDASGSNYVDTRRNRFRALTKPINLGTEAQSGQHVGSRKLVIGKPESRKITSKVRKNILGKSKGGNPPSSPRKRVFSKVARDCQHHQGRSNTEDNHLKMKDQRLKQKKYATSGSSKQQIVPKRGVFSRISSQDQTAYNQLLLQGCNSALKGSSAVKVMDTSFDQPGSTGNRNKSHMHVKKRARTVTGAASVIGSGDEKQQQRPYLSNNGFQKLSDFGNLAQSHWNHSKEQPRSCMLTSASSDMQSKLPFVFEGYRDPTGGDSESSNQLESSFLNEEEMSSADEASIGMTNKEDMRGTEQSFISEKGNTRLKLDNVPVTGSLSVCLPNFARAHSYLAAPHVETALSRQDLIDHDSVGSPTSIASTISNSTPGICDANFSTPTSSRRSLMFNNAMKDTVAVSLSLDLQTEACVTDKDKLNPETMHSDSCAFRFKDGHSCCCMPKGFSQNNSAVFQEHETVKQWGSGITPASDNRVESNFGSWPNLNSKPDAFSPFVQPCPLQLSDVTDVSSATPSSSSSVLRLMGKNLMVGNQDESRSHTKNDDKVSRGIPSFKPASSNVDPVNACHLTGCFCSGVYHPYSNPSFSGQRLLQQVHTRESCCCLPPNRGTCCLCYQSQLPLIHEACNEDNAIASGLPARMGYISDTCSQLPGNPLAASSPLAIQLRSATRYCTPCFHSH